MTLPKPKEAVPEGAAAPAAPITVAIVEDDRGTRDQLIALLAQEPTLQCIAAFAHAEQALAQMPLSPPNVALVDINLPGMSGIDCVAQLTARLPALRVLMLTAYKDSDLIFRSLRAGARGYLLKKFVADELVHAVEQVNAGGAPMSMQVASQVVEYFHQQQQQATPDLPKLTQRENEILALLAQGLLYKEIVDRLGISMSTVRTHLQRIYDKLHVNSRAEAAAKFFRR